MEEPNSVVTSSRYALCGNTAFRCGVVPREAARLLRFRGLRRLDLARSGVNELIPPDASFRQSDGMGGHAAEDGGEDRHRKQDGF